MALTKVVTFKRIKDDAPRDDAGQVDESLPANWEVLGKRRAEVAQVSNSESQGSDQQVTSSAWALECRGDELTKSIKSTDRIEHIAHGKAMTLNITGIRTIKDVPHYIEFTAEESK